MSKKAHISFETKENAYALFLRGMEIPDIARELHVEAADTARWVADRMVVEGEADEQNATRKAAGDSLRALKRALWVGMQSAEHKAGYGAALASIEQKLLKVDGRCGARKKRTNPPEFCRKYPIDGKTRCRDHGGASLAGPDHPSYRHGFYAKGGPQIPDEKDIERYMAEGYKLNRQVAEVKAIHAMAVRSGNPQIVATVTNALAHIAKAGKEIADGAVVRIVLDEQSISKVVELLLGVMMLEVHDPDVLARISDRFGDIDWNKAIVPALPATTPAPNEQA